MAKKLIEVALPLEAINKAAAKEKSIRHGHPSTLHLWWARRPLAAARAVLFAQLVDDPSTWPELQGDEDAQKRERQRLFQMIEDMVPWEATQDERLFREVRREIARSHARFHRGVARSDRMLATDVTPAEVNDYLATELPPVHDPFAGGGTIPLEAQRLGLRAIASDLNPVAVLINKALIEIPPKFAGKPPINPESSKVKKDWKGAEGLAEDVRYYGKWMRDEAFKRIGHLYPKAQLPKELGGGEATVIAWLWARTVTCSNPACGATMPLARSFVLSTKPGKEHWVEPVVDAKSKTVRFEVRKGKSDKSGGTVDRRGARCVVCAGAVPLEHIREEGRAGRMGAQMMAIVAEGARGRVYVNPEEYQIDAAIMARPEWGPEQLLATHPQYMAAPRYGMVRVRDLFTSRQCLLLSTLSDVCCSPIKETDNKEVQESIWIYRALAIGKSADYNASLVLWSTARDQAVHVFGRQALPMTWDYCEVNPFAQAAGDAVTSLDGIAKTLEALPAGRAGTVFSSSASASMTSGTRIISTDPPYYDNVPYSDLADFFYAWIRAALLPASLGLTMTMVCPKDEEMVADQIRFGGRDAAAHVFEERFRQVFATASTAHESNTPMAVYYAFKQMETEDESGPEVSNSNSTGWETILGALIQTGWATVGTWPVRTERAGRMREIGANALASSIVIVCRKRPESAPTATRAEFQRALKRALPRDLKLLQQGNIAPVDFAQAAIGPGMAVYSSYAKVIESDGSPLKVRTALQLINQVLDEVLSEQEGDFDTDTRWALAWFEQHQYAEAEYGVAETLSKAKNTSVAGLVEAGLLTASRGKVRLRARKDLDAGWDPATDARRTVWEVCQHMIRALDAGGEREAAGILAKVGAQGEAARELAYRLYALCERKKWSQEALGYNALVTAWPELARLAGEPGARGAGDAGEAQGELGLG